MRAGLGALLGAALLAALPPALGFHPYYLFLLSTAFLYAAVASAWNLLAYAGPISLGHAAFFGLGAYGAALASLGGLSPWGAIALGGLAGAGGAAGAGLLSIRLRGAYLALGTLACAELLRGLALHWSDVTGGGAGLVGIPALPVLRGWPRVLTEGRAGAYYLALALLGATLGLFALIRGSRVGLAFAAVREEEERASVLGLRPLPWTLLAFALSGLVTALCGGLYAHTVRVVEPDLVFNRHYSFLPLVMATVGGLHTLLGPAAAAIALYLVSELVLHPLLPALHQVGYALALIAVVLYLPGGLGGPRAGGSHAHP